MTKPQQISLTATLALTVLTVVVLMVMHLRWQPGEAWPPEPDPYIELQADQEFIEPEQLPLPANAPGDLSAAAKTDELMDQPSRPAPQSGANVSNGGPQGEPTHEVTTPRPSNTKMEQQPQPVNPGAATATEKPKPSAQQTSVRNRFDQQGRHNAANRDGDQANAGNPNGNPNSAGPANSTSSSVGYGRIGGGWQWPRYSQVKTAKAGSITFEIIIDANGTATNATAIKGDPDLMADSALKSKCIAEIRRRKFTRPAGSQAPDEATAFLTFTFK